MEQEIYEGFSAQREMAGERLRTESTGEYSLPDYRPEIRRILGVSTRLLPSGQYLAGGRAELAGICAHTLLYSTADGSVAAVELTSEYSFVAPASDLASVHILPATVESSVCRLLGPRKLSIRASLSAVPHVIEAVECGEALSDMLPDPDIMTLSHPVTLRRSRILTLEDVAYSDTVRLEESEAELLSSRGSVAVREATPGREGMLCRGEIRLEALLSSDDGIPRSIAKQIPFEVLIPSQGELTSADGTAWGSLHSFSATAAPSSDGGTAVTFDAVVCFTAEAVWTETAHPVVDLFSVKSPLHALSESIPYSDFLPPRSTVIRAEGGISRSESDSEEACAVIDTFPEAHVTGWEIDGSTLRLRGECRVGMALALSPADADGQMNYGAAAFPIPFETTLSFGEELPADASVEICAIPLSARGRIDPGNLAAEVELQILCRISRTLRQQIATGAEADGDAKHAFVAPGEILAVYLDEGDSLWSVARKYSISPEALAEANGLPPEALQNADLPSSLDGCARLLVEGS